MTAHEEQAMALGEALRRVLAEPGWCNSLELTLDTQTGELDLKLVSTPVSTASADWAVMVERSATCTPDEAIEKVARAVETLLQDRQMVRSRRGAP